MHGKPVTTSFASIHQRRAAAEQQIQDQLQACQEEQATVRMTLSELQQRLDHLLNYQSRLNTELAEVAQRSFAEERAAAVTALDASFASFLQLCAYWLAQARFERQMQALYAQDPALDKKIEAHQKAASGVEAYLESIPEMLRLAVTQAVQTEIEKIRHQLAPWLDLQQQRRDLRPDGPLAIQLMLVQPAEDELLYWVLPFPASPMSLAPEVAPIMIQAANLVVQALGGFGKHTDWSIDDLDLASWDGSSVLVALATYRGEVSIEQSAANLLKQQLATEPLFQDVLLNLRIERMSQEAWQLGAYQTATLPSVDLVQTTTPEAIGAEKADEADDQAPEGELASDWFTSSDLKLWSRKQSGKLTPQEQRMRTLAIRMIGRGLLGETAVSVGSLCQGLPATHAEALRHGIELGTKAGVLLKLEVADGAEPAITLNPALLTDVQSLINREPSALWANEEDGN
ncbi:hypothetical protein [Candidatus Chloroploca asiatica]|uniref:Uncharacterized protein n=1 Tax=Candidatus Chloroploca asiatica TaxID=1506545 RepID=A0A2H3L1X6_9CHLR|nr:hypothetical protein [Candidatus Chloroploca asiatica]PDV97157.1 hypothetical protein A9Q02_19085 [Candidatus Chloroploca asiatica]